MIHKLFIIPLAALCVTTQLYSAETATAPAAITSQQIFQTEKIWDIHLTFTAEQWKAMEPVQGRRPERGRDRSFLLGPEGGRNGIAAAFGIEYRYVHANLEFGPHKIKEVGVRYKGNGTFLTSRDSLKRSLKIDTNQFVKGQKLAGMTQLNLHNSVRDPSGMNETVAYGLFRAAKVPAPRTAYAKVFVTVPDLYEKKYFGLYDLVEDVGARFAKQHFDTSEGAIFKPVTSSLFGDLGDDWKAYNQTYDPKGTLTDADKKRMIEICKYVSSSSAEDFAKGLENYFELDNLARYLALTAWMCDLDGIMGPGQNYYMYLHPKTRKISFIAWDQDQTFGQFPRGTQEQRENLSILRPWNGRNSFMEKLYAAEPFKVKYLATLAELNKSVLRAEGIHKQVDELAKLLNVPIKEESATRLADFVKAAAGETIAVTMGPGYREPVQTKPIKPYVTMRWKSVDDQLVGRSEGMTISGR